MRLKHLTETQQLSKDAIFDLFESADKLRENPKPSLKGKILSTLFYEPSTRTRLSFESAMMRLGGNVISTENAAEFSSAIKGESLEDTIRVIHNYADGIVLRHKEDGSADKAAEVSNVPIINAGDGMGQHPTQALLDLYTIHRECEKKEGIKIAIVGDLACGRTVRSLSYLMGKMNNSEIVYVSPENLKVGKDITDYLDRKGVSYVEDKNLNDVLPHVDVIYMTRIQKERMALEDYEKAKGKYVIDLSNLNLIRNSSRILHPLPHVEELDIPLEVENTDPRIAYFRQVENGLYVRMAILDHLLS